MMKANGDRELACSSCNYRKWFAWGELTGEERQELESLIEQKRGPRVQTRPVFNRKPRVVPKANPEPDIKPLYKPKLKPKPKPKENVAIAKGKAKVKVKKPALPPAEADLLNKIKKVFRSKIKKVLPRYAERPAQLELSQRIGSSLVSNSILLAEAGVGTGKSFAYLVPATQYYTEGPVLVSTKTIILQEQLTSKDIPLISQIKGLPVLLSKGQSHFLCGVRYSKTKLPQNIPVILLEQLEEWVCDTETGDRSEAPPVPDTIWELINVEDCEGRDCHLYNGYCGFIKYKEKRKHFKGMIVCNHNLLINDLMLRSRQGKGLWPAPRAIIIDEAHGLLDACRQELSQNISSKYVEKTLKKVLNNKRIASTLEYISDGNVINSIFDSLDVFQELVSQGSDTTDEFSRYLVPNTPEVIEKGRQITCALSSLASNMDLIQGYGLIKEKNSRLLDRMTFKIKNICRKIKAWVNNPENYYLAARKIGKDPLQSSVELTVAPIDVSGFLANLWGLYVPVVLTSGTLSTDGKFEHVKDLFGLGTKPRVREHIGQAKLTNDQNVAYYMPPDLPVPRHDNDDFTEAAADRIAEMLKITQGRALVLFTSYRRLDKVYEFLFARRDLPWTLLKQGQAGVRNLLERFRNEESSVLLATGSFWEGVDVVGPSLSMVIMDKLPFPAPEDPLIKARVRKEKEKGANPLQTIYIPEMLLRLKQGSGRLLRNEDDFGIIAILDNRATRRYFELIQKTLPPGVKCNSMGELKEWYRSRQKVSA